MTELLQYEFMRNALMAGFLTSVACGIIGSLVVVNRVVFLSGGIAHSAYGGIGLAFFLGVPPLLGAGAFALAMSALMAWVTLEDRRHADTVIGVIWAVGMALGILFVDLTPGYNVDLMSYLFGSILAVPRWELGVMAGAVVVILFTVGYFYRSFLALSYDREFAATRGVPVRALYFLMVALIALTVVMLISLVGLILVIALLSIPPFIAEKYSSSLGQMMGFSFLLSLFFTLSGLLVAYRFNLTPGATIILVAGAGFFLSLIPRKKRKIS